MANGNGTPAPGSTTSAPHTPPEKVLVAIPYGHTFSGSVVHWLFSRAVPEYPQVRVSLIQHRASGFVEDSRQAIVDGFMDEMLCRAPWLLMLDPDNAPRLSPMQMVTGAEAAGVDLVISPVPFHAFRAQQRGISVNVFDETPDGQNYAVPYHQVPWHQKERYWPVRSGGLGCTLISRRSLTRALDQARKGKMQYPFRAVWRQGRMILSEDISFFARMRKLGYPAYCDLDNPCSHEKTWTMDPQHAIDDLKTVSPLETPHPDAPRSIPEGWTKEELQASIDAMSWPSTPPADPSSPTEAP